METMKCKSCCDKWYNSFMTANWPRKIICEHCPNKEWKNVLSDTGVSIDRQSMIDKIYEVVKPTHFAFISTDDWLSWRDVEYVMIWDLLDKLNLIDYWLWYVRWTDLDDNACDKLLLLYKKMRQPIEDQKIDCIKYVYDLISEK